jgi:ATP-dependent DNA ligase
MVNNGREAFFPWAALGKGAVRVRRLGHMYPRRYPAPCLVEVLSLNLPIEPPFHPMLARLSRELPRNGFIYEPKWDGFRCLVFADEHDIDLRSRNQRPLARYFPELVDAFVAMGRRFAMDGEIVVVTSEGADFDALLQRLHPAARRVQRLARETPASFIAFDLLARGWDEFVNQPFATRRSALADLLAGQRPPLFLTPVTEHAADATKWLELGGGGIDGVMAKDPAGRYEPGKRALTKVKLDRTADCVVAGFRWHHSEPAVGSLLLGLYDEQEVLRHVGLTSSFTAARRRSLSEEIRPFVTSLESHPWGEGFPQDRGPVGRLPGAASRWGYEGEPTWVPLSPELVCEVSYDHLQRGRFRHPPQFRRWRPDRDALTCTYAQFEMSSLDLPKLLVSP